MDVDHEASVEPWDQPRPYIRFLRKHIWIVGALFLMTLITVMRPFLVRRPPPPPPMGEIPSFALLDQEGERFTRDDLLAADRTWIIGFVFTRCPSSCPAISRAMLAMQEQLVAAKVDEHVELLTITVDPEHDTPEILSAYARELGADTSQWRFLTGESEAIEALVVGGFKLAVGEREAVEGEVGVFDIAHSTKLVLVDRFGVIRGYYSIDDEGMAELFHRTLRVIRVEDPNEGAMPEEPEVAS